jgi:hypothetical protein
MRSKFESSKIIRGISVRDFALVNEYLILARLTYCSDAGRRAIDYSENTPTVRTCTYSTIVDCDTVRLRQ